ncbi:MAG: DUF6497 family protein [Pseudomonadota bacterium]
MSDRWHILSQEGRYTLARHLPVRFDVWASALFPKMRKDRLARQIRQDMWRALRQTRGFSPVVQVSDTADGLEVKAGGRLSSRVRAPASMEETISDLLHDPAARVRWQRWAALGLVALLPMFAAPSHAQEVPVDVPSGQPMTLVGVLLDESPGALWARFRFVAPDIGTRVAADVAAEDMDFLCSAVAVPYIQYHQIEPARIVVSLSDRPVEFGKKAPEATQFFEAYAYRDNTCIWEAF